MSEEQTKTDEYQRERAKHFCSIGIQEGKLCIMRERGRTESREQKRRKNCVAGTRRRGYFM